MAFIKEESEDIKVVSINKEIEDVKIEETLRVKREDTEKQTDLIALKEKRQELNAMEEKDHDFMTGEKSTQTKKNSLKKRARTIICTSSVTCKLCGWPFGCKASLKKHMRYYSGKTTHKCKVCGKSFIREGNLYLHLNSPLEWKPFACPQCEKCVFRKKT